MDAELSCEANKEAPVNENDQQQLIVADAPVEEQKPDVFKLDFELVVAERFGCIWTNLQKNATSDRLLFPIEIPWSLHHGPER